MAADGIYQTLLGCLSGSTLTLPSTTFAGGIADVLATYFPNSTLVADNVVLTQQGEGAAFQNATGGPGPLSGMTIAATFSPGSSGVTLLLTATPPASWTFDKGWPLLANTWMASLGVSGAVFTLTSVAQSPLAKGLNFSGGLTLGPAWSAALWLLGGSGVIAVSGPIGQSGTVPTFAFKAPVSKPIEVPVLGTLTLSMVISCAAVSGKVNPPASRMPRLASTMPGTGPISAPWVPQIGLGLTTTITLARSPVPIFIDLSAPGGLIPITADVSQLSLVTLQDFVSLLQGADLSTALPPPSEFNPGQYLALKTLTFTLAPKIPKLVSAEIVLGSTKSWPVTDGISVGPVNLAFTVAFGPISIMASLTGPVNFTGGSFQLGAYYPGFMFTGGLAPDSKVNLTALMNAVLPITVNATLILDQLNFVVIQTTGSFSLTTGLVGDWAIPVGIATIHLTGAWMELERQGATTGSIAVQGTITSPTVARDIVVASLSEVASAPGPITFNGSWTLPGTFSLAAAFPDIHLTKLAAQLTDQSIPSGVPDVALTNGALSLTLNLSSGEYSFALATSASVNDTSIGTGLFVVRKAQSGSGFVIGFVIPQTWSPAQIWPQLGSLFDKLTFSNSGLVISTLPAGSAIDLPNLKQASLPASVNPGFTFFTSLALKGDILGPISHLFDDNISFDLLAVVDTAAPANSVFQAIYQGSKGKNAVQFTGITVTLKPAAMSFSLSAGAILNIESEHITLLGVGTIALEPPSMSFTILIENWVQPFGIKNLTVKAFGLQVGVEAAILSVSLLGSFDIGAGDNKFTLVVGGKLDNFEVPAAILFELVDDNPQRPLMLSDVINQFTSLDLSHVPILGHVGFKTLEFWVVDDPAGFKSAATIFRPASASSRTSSSTAGKPSSTCRSVGARASSGAAASTTRSRSPVSSACPTRPAPRARRVRSTPPRSRRCPSVETRECGRRPLRLTTSRISHSTARSSSSPSPGQSWRRRRARPSTSRCRSRSATC